MIAPKIVKAPMSECVGYLTPGKEYEAFKVAPNKNRGFTFHLIDDDGFELQCVLTKSSHLFGKDWLIVEPKTKDARNVKVTYEEVLANGEETKKM